MAYCYIQFETKESEFQEEKENWIINIIKRILTFLFYLFIPRANSKKYEANLAQVKTWLLEIDLETELPEREIGIDEAGKVIVIAPEHGDYGNFTDNNIKLRDFISKWKAIPIEKQSFDNYWNDYYKSNIYYS